MIKNIVFDMGNVLIPYDPEKYLAAFVEKEEDRNLLRKEVFCSLEWLKTDKGEMTLDEAVESINKKIPTRLHNSVEKLVKNWIDITEPFPEMENLILELKDKGYKLYLLSNTSNYYHVFKQKIPIIAQLDGEFISAGCGHIKPHKDIYLAFLDKFGLVSQECFFVDDMPLNIDGANQVGIAGTVYHGDAAQLKEVIESFELN